VRYLTYEAEGFCLSDDYLTGWAAC